MAQPKPFITAVILAAGSSSRMGQSKQLLKINEKSLVKKTVEEVIKSGVDRTFIVLGSDNQAIQKELEAVRLEVVFNPEWNKGIGSSIKCGLAEAMKSPELNAVIFSVCDQPLLRAFHVKKLIYEYTNSRNQIVASRYAGSDGVPALFDRSMFTKLMRIADQAGAKKIIEQNSTLVKSIDFPDGLIDLDTPKDYQQFLERDSNL
ncbi:MAG: nucleotidyltransferase family protein [Bacteroidetes bacterium]|nr:nucleotidyltransferase family protein [Bacteroidota bacterium]